MIHAGVLDEFSSLFPAMILELTASLKSVIAFGIFGCGVWRKIGAAGSG